MMELRMCLFLLATLPGSLALGDMHFMGGTMSFKFIDTSKAPYKLRITAVTGWVLGMGPCGSSCNASDVGRSTDDTRKRLTDINGETYFGNWTKEVELVNSTRTIHEVITPEVISKIHGHVADVSVQMKFEQEIAEFDIDIDPTAKYTDISLHGSYWRWFNYTHGVTSYPTNYELQVKVIPAIREDTKKPNTSPVVMFLPVYRIELNRQTTIKLSTLDEDADFVKCGYAHYVDAGGLATLKNTVINPDCSIVIDPEESDGFVDGGWGAIAVKVMDYPKKPMAGASQTGDPTAIFSAISVQFMIQTLRTLDAPEFVEPTPQSQHEFTIYVGSTFTMSLYAKAMEYSVKMDGLDRNYNIIVKENPCATSPCKNGGVCKPGNTSYVCTCPVGYEGKDCTAK